MSNVDSNVFIAQGATLAMVQPDAEEPPKETWVRRGGSSWATGLSSSGRKPGPFQGKEAEKTSLIERIEEQAQACGGQSF